MSGFRYFFMALLLIVMLGGCGPEALPGELGDVSPGQEEGSPTQPGSGESGSQGEDATPQAAYVATHSWMAPQEPTPMGPTSDRFCFLNRVRGRFDNNGDAVQVSMRGGHWYLGGRSHVDATRAMSRCSTLPAGTSLSGEYEWTAGQRFPKNLGSAAGRVCFLTGVGGRFDDAGDWVRVYVNGGSWYLFGSAGSARARCVPVGSYSAEYSWEQPQGRDTSMGSTSGRTCALTSVGGRFDGLNDYVEIYSSAGSWYLSGTTQQAGVFAKARCF